MTDCDFCGAEYSVTDRRVAAVPRPSDPTELVAIMWGCGKCSESEGLPTIDRIWKDFEAGCYPGVLWVTI